jgi:hypothetical protein
MQEVRDLATSIKDAVTSLKSVSEGAKAALAYEVIRASVNADKVNSFIQELKDANKEVEELLGSVGSNFPPADHKVSEVKATASKSIVDLNGVSLNKES